jgi:kynurenine formamidase
MLQMQSNFPATGAKVCVMPIKIKDGTESPIRLIALV